MSETAPHNRTEPFALFRVKVIVQPIVAGVAAGPSQKFVAIHSAILAGYSQGVKVDGNYAFYTQKADFPFACFNPYLAGAHGSDLP